ncbi:hypothetical protein [Paenibacillus nasutitermitis]|uniref:Uncharacterized protein n=1 Tax=Paenibacillus nasutitermitis TaxID=1652958 RepID=A0A916YRV7_9BACL|nr:hypothetical protein [Paenibacillus nasutitermitis]GGD58000.1 hypothetical protein GCM10010911_14770 [Paenibacillus nasutitermitis]
MEQLTNVIDLLSDEELAEIAGGMRCQDCSMTKNCGSDFTGNAVCQG